MTSRYYVEWAASILEYVKANNYGIQSEDRTIRLMAAKIENDLPTITQEAGCADCEVVRARRDIA